MKLAQKSQNRVALAIVLIIFAFFLDFKDGCLTKLEAISHFLLQFAELWVLEPHILKLEACMVKENSDDLSSTKTVKVKELKLFSGDARCMLR